MTNVLPAGSTFIPVSTAHYSVHHGAPGPFPAVYLAWASALALAFYTVLTITRWLRQRDAKRDPTEVAAAALTQFLFFTALHTLVWMQLIVDTLAIGWLPPQAMWNQWWSFTLACQHAEILICASCILATCFVAKAWPDWKVAKGAVPAITLLVDVALFLLWTTYAVYLQT